MGPALSVNTQLGPTEPTIFPLLGVLISDRSPWRHIRRSAFLSDPISRPPAACRKGRLSVQGQLQGLRGSPDGGRFVAEASTLSDQRITDDASIHAYTKSRSFRAIGGG